MNGLQIYSSKYKELSAGTHRAIRLNSNPSCDSLRKESFFKIFEPIPNPCTDRTIIEYSLSIRSRVEIKIYDQEGGLMLEVINEILEPGIYKHMLDTTSLQPGSYYIRSGAGFNYYTMLLVVQ